MTLVVSVKNSSLPDDIRKKISDKLKGRTFSEEHKNKIKIALTGKPKSEEHKSKLRKPRTQEQKDRLKGPRPSISGENNPMFGKTHTKEARDKISVAHIGREAWNKGVKKTEEQMKNIMEGIKNGKSRKGNGGWARGQTKETNLSLKKHSDNMKTKPQIRDAKGHFVKGWQNFPNDTTI
jgi:hypothetical protein